MLLSHQTFPHFTRIREKKSAESQSKHSWAGVIKNKKSFWDRNRKNAVFLKCVIVIVKKH